ncbi:hypothetical protein [Streptosporangium sp. OZ121]|uniref:hypothetical protein n=1 Tax=Streptosporangium sp. OZ121 TaxID=3444183 RepID=UPI003F7962EA
MSITIQPHSVFLATRSQGKPVAVAVIRSHTCRRIRARARAIQICSGSKAPTGSSAPDGGVRRRFAEQVLVVGQQGDLPHASRSQRDRDRELDERHAPVPYRGGRLSGEHCAQRRGQSRLISAFTQEYGSGVSDEPFAVPADRQAAVPWRSVHPKGASVLCDLVI